MNLTEEIKAMVKKEAIHLNAFGLVTTLILICISICFILLFASSSDIVFMIFAIMIALLAIKAFFKNKISLDDEHLKEWHMSLSKDDSLVKKIDNLIFEKWEGERSNINLKEYVVMNKKGRCYLSFTYQDETITLPLNEVKYDEGEKRIEFYISDKDWSVNLKKGTKFAFQIFNV